MGYIEKTITICGQDVIFKASAASPRLYRKLFGRDIMKDMARLTKAVANEDVLDIDNLELFENLAYTFAVQGAGAHGLEIESEPDAWLDNFEMFDIYEILPQIVELWGNNRAELVQPKKK